MALSRLNRIRLITFVAVLVSLLFFHGSLNSFIAKRGLMRDATKILVEINHAIIESERLLSELASDNRFTCNAADIPELNPVLAQAVYETSYVRWLGLAKQGRYICESSRYDWRRGQPFVPLPLSGDFYLATINTEQVENVIVLALKYDGGFLIANIEPPNLEVLTQSVCEQCMAYEVNIHGDTSFKFGHSVLAEDIAATHTVTITDETLTYDLTVSANEVFVEHYRLMGWLLSLLVSTVIAACISGLVGYIVAAKSSLRHVIINAIEQNQFVPFYQPIVDSRNKRVVGAEVLIRWQKPNGELIPPNQFIPYAEESLLILPMTKALVTKVAGDIKNYAWHSHPLYLSVNLVPEHVDDDHFLEQLQALIKHHGLSAECFSIELTERRQLGDLDVARAQLNKFVEYGIEVKIDDAGTGYGGFSYIQELPIGTLKIDKMFIDTLGDKQDAKKSVLDAIVNFAHASKLNTIAEGVEHESQVEQLKDRGVYHIQGYVYGKPMSANDFNTWLGEFESPS